MTALERICGSLSRAGVRYAIVGGHAVALHGAVRGTVDIDLAIAWNHKTLVAAEKALNEVGLVSRLPVTADNIFDFRKEYIENRNLIEWSFYNPTDLSEQVDIVITYDLKGKRTKRIQLSNGPVQILDLKELIKMKRKSARPQDIEDVLALERLL
jgi:predicted nucleotidyltransferase